MSTILYTKDFGEKIEKEVDVILSPEFYWIKKIDIPLKSLYQAKKIAKNLFDLEGEYIYDAIKIDNKFFAIAIKKDLNINIDKKFIKGIYLAQELYKYDCISFKNKTLKKIEDIIFIFNEKSDCIKFEDIDVSLSNKIKINKVENKYLTPILIAFVIINALIFTNTIQYNKLISQLQQKKEKLLIENHLPTTTFELTSILNSLKEIDRKETNIKRALEFFSKTPLDPQDFYKLLQINKNYYVEIKASSNLDEYFKKHFKIITSSYKNNIYKAELSE